MIFIDVSLWRVCKARNGDKKRLLDIFLKEPLVIVDYEMN